MTKKVQINKVTINSSLQRRYRIPGVSNQSSNVSRLTKKYKLSVWGSEFASAGESGGGERRFLARTESCYWVCAKQCWGSGSGSGRIRIIFQDRPDPDRYPFQPNEKVDKADFFLENFDMLSKTLKTYDTFDTDEKDKTLGSGNAVTKGKKKIWFWCVKLGGRIRMRIGIVLMLIQIRIRIWIASTWKFGAGSGSASKWCRSTTLCESVASFLYVYNTTVHKALNSTKAICPIHRRGAAPDDCWNWGKWDSKSTNERGPSFCWSCCSGYLPWLP